MCVKRVQACSGTAALFVFLAAAATAGVVAAGRLAFDDLLHARAKAAPDFAQVVHRPQRFGVGVQAGLADAGWAIFAKGGQSGFVGVVLSQGDDGFK